MKSEKVIVIGSHPDSLVNFRGELIKAICGSGKKVITVSGPSEASIKDKISELGACHTDITFQRNGLNPIADIKSLWCLYRLFKKEKPDLILAYTIKPVIWGGIAARLAGVNFYALITGLGFAFQGQSLFRRLLTWLVSSLYKVSLGHASEVIFQNNDNCALFVDRQIVAQEKARIVDGSGVDIDHFSYSSIEKSKSFRFLCIARLLGDKGLREYFRAAEIVKQRYPEANFVLVGPEDSSPDAISLEEVTTWVKKGVVDYKGGASDVRPFIRQSHVYVLPSYHEGLPRSTIEAMAMGRAVLTTNAVGCKETVEEGKNGFTVPVQDEYALANKMIWFIENQDRVSGMGIESHRIAKEKFDVRKVNAEMLEIMRLKR